MSPTASRHDFKHLLVAAATLAAILGLAPPAAAAPTGPTLRTPTTALNEALTCPSNLATAAKTPVLLVHGTGATPREDWGRNYMKWLPARGYPTCTVTIPTRALGDLQTNVEYVVYAIREMAERSGRKIAVIGHSQGGFLPSFALRFWPDLASKVDDLIGFAGTYTYGTNGANLICGTPATCLTAFTQFKPGSNLLVAIAAVPLPTGPAYTAYSTRYDEVVTPQPLASTLVAPGARNYVLQDICPLDIAEHLLINDETPLLGLTLDALANAGPADRSRAGKLTCGVPPGVLLQAPAAGLTFAAGLVAAAPSALNTSMTEPPVRCEFTQTC